ncbi:hypothetical protein SCT_2855 [Sulfuricella sp. T08]|uniref:hypothetical protein n=1 Tax=Sulfuricella sp. T08 TaxID=1632857 RepID=UPI00061799D9|nr:hypothetical protein [Sulfuricella sp. T08]GAO37430.1 hypothetical protein SCT_2855 [Sulfuricella sp. T08]
MDLADFLINVHPELPMNERAQLEDEIGHMEGVVSACFNPNHPHMMTVTYNPDAISSSKVMAQVGKHGIEASKVGL